MRVDTGIIAIHNQGLYGELCTNVSPPDPGRPVVGTGMKMRLAVLCTLSIGGSRTSTLADSPDIKLVRYLASHYK